VPWLWQRQNIFDWYPYNSDHYFICHDLLLFALPTSLELRIWSFWLIQRNYRIQFSFICTKTFLVIDDSLMANSFFYSRHYLYIMWRLCHYVVMLNYAFNHTYLLGRGKILFSFAAETVTIISHSRYLKQRQPIFDSKLY
jgi:hypothetical protein